MEYTTIPYPGYRLKPKYVSIISEHPANSGRLFKDDNGRPSGHVLACFYLGCGPNHYDAEQACKAAERYPGRFTTTSFGEDYLPRDEYDRMTHDA